MSLTITDDMMRLQQAAESMGYGSNSAAARMLREIEEINRVQKQMDVISQIEALKQKALEPMRTLTKAFQRGYEQIQRGIGQYERLRQELEIIERLRRQLQIVRHRCHSTHSPLSSKGKTSSSRKGAKPAGGSGGGSSGSSDGGDGGGDGDGPQRSSSTSKKTRSSKSVTTQPSRLPSTSPGKTAITSPKVSPIRPTPSRGIAYLATTLLFGIVLTEPGTPILTLVVICLLVIALAAMGHADVAKEVWKSTPNVFKQLDNGKDAESEDSNEED